MDPSNWFGLTNGTMIGEPPLYVDKTLGPGLSMIPKPTLWGWVQRAPTVLIKTPNFVWACVALILYGIAPYDLSSTSAAATGPLTLRFFQERFPIWFALTLGYDTLWHVALYTFNLASRPFVSGRVYNVDKVVHNIVWTTSGIAIWTAFENVMCYLWATGRLSYIPDATSFTSVEGAVAFAIALAAIPLWRSLHFYFAHRFLHMEDMYRQVHSLHHRNTDVEPFSGLCMHPVEHLYYFACVLPSLVVYCSPFAFLWNGVHLLLSPGASHSGYEDHFQSDAFHYMHHRYFECNYAGTDAAFLDIWFGTFQGSFREEDRQDAKPREDAKSSLRILPTQEFVAYLSASALCFLPLALRTGSASPVESTILALLAGTGPVAIASLFSKMGRTPRGMSRVPMTNVGTFIHLFIGFLFCCVPIAVMGWLILQP